MIPNIVTMNIYWNWIFWVAVENWCTYQLHMVIIEVHNCHFHYFELMIIRMQLLLVIIGVYYYSKKIFFFFFSFSFLCLLFFSFLFFGECHKSKTFLILSFLSMVICGATRTFKKKKKKKIFCDIVIQSYSMLYL